MIKIEILHSSRAKLTRRDGATTEVELHSIHCLTVSDDWWTYEDGQQCGWWLDWRLNRARRRYLNKGRKLRAERVWQKQAATK
jgi:hypothetical protein